MEAQLAILEYRDIERRSRKLRAKQESDKRIVPLMLMDTPNMTFEPFGE